MNSTELNTSMFSYELPRFPNVFFPAMQQQNLNSFLMPRSKSK